MVSIEADGLGYISSRRVAIGDFVLVTFPIVIGNMPWSRKSPLEL